MASAHVFRFRAARLPLLARGQWFTSRPAGSDQLLLVRRNFAFFRSDLFITLFAGKWLRASPPVILMSLTGTRMR